jgi:hypothetical protein
MFFADPTAAFANLLAATRRVARCASPTGASLADDRHWLISYEVVLRRLGRPEPAPQMRLARSRLATLLTCARFSDRRGLPTLRSIARTTKCSLRTRSMKMQPDEVTRRTIWREIEDAFATYL